MKHLLPIFLLIAHFSFGQDTLGRATYSGVLRQYVIVFGQDTVMQVFYADGTLKSERRRTEGNKFSYKRYYPNGQLMWEQVLVDEKTVGKASFYDEKGKVAGIFSFQDGVIVDTIALSRKHTLLLGSATHFSKVYGGMERVRRDDEPIEEDNGPWKTMFTPMYVVKLDSTKTTQTKYRSFETDFKGDFMLVLPKGVYGFFPEHHSLESITAKQGGPLSVQGKSHHSTWSPSAPTIITNQKLIRVYLHSTSVGYAP